MTKTIKAPTNTQTKFTVTVKSPTLRAVRDAAERAVIVSALQSAKGDLGEARKTLKVGLSSLYRYIAEFKLTDAEQGL